VTAIRSGEYRLLVCNLANPDMIGHTGDLAAAVTACEAVDGAVGRIAEATLAMGGALFITADHGNCECMRDEGGQPHTAHTLNPVPAVLVGQGFEAVQLRSGGALSDVAPTLLGLLGLPQPEAMDGKSLL
jgi:2,3-bisphosphoglycerate-independent phosphoglycerate mutase